jgi:hypothetical protein
MEPNFENQIVNTQTGGETPVATINPPKNLGKVETPVVDNQQQKISTTPSTVQPIQQQQSAAATPESVSFKINEEVAIPLYEQAKKYAQDVQKVNLNYDKFVGKFLSSPEAAQDYYKKLIHISKDYPLTINVGTVDQFMQKLNSPSQKETQLASVASGQEGVVNQQQADISKLILPQTPEKSLVGVDLKDFIKQEPTEIEKSEKPLIEKLALEMKEEDKSKVQKDIAVQKKLDELTLKNWDPISDSSFPAMPKENLPQFDLDFSKGMLSVAKDKKAWEYDIAAATQFTDEDKDKYGSNPMYSFTRLEDVMTPAFDWDATLEPGMSSTEYWNKVNNEIEDIPLSKVDAYGGISGLRAMPVSAQKIMNDYWKHQATMNPEETKLWMDVADINKVKTFHDGKYPETKDSFGDRVFGELLDLFTGNTQKKDYNATIETAKKHNVVDLSRTLIDIENAFGHQKKVILGEYYKNLKSGIDTREETENALSALMQTYNKVYEVNPRLNERKRKFEKMVVDQEKTQERADIKEKLYREKNPFLASVYYDFGGAGFEEGGKAVINDFANTVDFITQSPSVLTSEMKDIAKPDVMPSSLQGNIWDDDGFHFGRLMNQSTNVVTQMGGLVIGSKGFSGLGTATKAITGIKKAEDVVPMFTASYIQTYDDYYVSAFNELKSNGYSDQAAELMANSYATRAAGTTSVLENLVGLPYINKVGSKIKSDYSALLKSGDNGFMAAAKAVSKNFKDFGAEVLKQGGEELVQEVGDKINNSIFNKDAGITMLDEDLTAEGVRDLLAVTGVSTLLMGVGTGNIYNSPLNKKAAIWQATQDPGGFNETVDTWVKAGKLDKEQATSMKSAVTEVKSAMLGLPSAKKLNDKQKLDLGLLIYEKKKIKEEASAGYVDEVFKEQKEKEIAGKVEKLDAKIKEVYNLSQKSQSVKDEIAKINKDKEEAENYTAQQLADARSRVLKNVEDLESEQDVLNKQFQPTGEKQKLPEQRERAVTENQRYDIEDGHHRFIAYGESGVKEIPAVDEKGNDITVPIESLQPTENLEEKDRKVIDDIKTSISKGDKIEPIEVKTPSNEIKKQQGVQTPGSGNGETIVKAQPDKTKTEVSEQRDEKVKPATKYERRLADAKDKIADVKTPRTTLQNAINKLFVRESKTGVGNKKTTTYVPWKNDKAGDGLLGVVKKEMGIEFTTADTPQKLYNAAIKQGKTPQQFIEAVDVAMGRKIQEKVQVEKTKTVKEEPVVVKQQPPRQDEYVRSANDEIVKLEKENSKIKESSDGLKERASKEKNTTYQKALKSIAEGIANPDLKSAKDLKIDGKSYGAWLLDQMNAGNITREQMAELNKIYSDQKDHIGKTNQNADAIKNKREWIKKRLQDIAALKYIGTDTLNMGLFAVPVNMTIAVAKRMANTMLKAMSVYDKAINYDKVGNEVIRDMKDTKWYKNLSSPEKKAINKYLNSKDPFDAVVSIIDDVARNKPEIIKGEEATGKRVGEIKGQRKQAAAEESKMATGKKVLTEKTIKGKKKVVYAEDKTKATETAAKNTANKLRDRIKTRSKSEFIALNDKKSLQLFLTVDPDALMLAGGVNAINEYNEFAKGVLSQIAKMGFVPGTTKLKNTKREISNDQISEYVKNAQEKASSYEFEKFKSDNKSLIDAMLKIKAIDADFTKEQLNEIINDFGLIDNVTEKVNGSIDPNKLKEMQLAVSDDLSRLNESIANKEFSDLEKRNQDVIKNVSKLNPLDLTAAEALKANYIINNIITNKDISGVGHIEAIAIAQQAYVELKKIIVDGKTLRDIEEGAISKGARTTPVLLAAIASNNDLAAGIREALKMQELGASYSDMSQQVQKNWSKKVRLITKQYGRDIIRNPENRIRQGMYALMLQWTGTTNKEQQNWYDDNKQLILEDIQTKKNSKQEDLIEEAKIEEKIFKSIFENSATIESAKRAMNKYPGDKAMVELAQDVYSKNITDFQWTSNVYGNNDFDLWNGYTHRKWKSKDSTGQFEQFDKTVQSNTDVGALVWNKHVNRKESTAAKQRSSVRPSDTRVLNLDFYYVQDRAINEAYYQSSTIGTRYAIREIFKNKNIEEIIGNKSMASLRERTLDAINHQMGATQLEVDMVNKVGKLINFVIRHKTAGALGGPSAFFQQSLPAVMGVLLRNPVSGYKTFKYIMYNPDENLFINSNLRSRKAAIYEGNIESMKSVKNTSYKRNASKLLAGIDELHKSTIENIVLKPLQLGDYHAAKGAWMMYYEKKWRKDNKGKPFNWNEQYENPDKKASAYADQMIETTMNVNDMSNAGKYFRSQGLKSKVIKTIFSPFASFAVNQDYRIINAFRNMISLSPKKVAEGSLEFASVVSEQMTFQYVRAAVGLATVWTTVWAAMSFGADDDEVKEIKDKRLRDIFTKEEMNRILMNVSFDILPTAVIASPYGMNAMESTSKYYLNEFFKENLGDDYKNVFTMPSIALYPDPNFEVSTETAYRLNAFGMLGEFTNDMIRLGKKGNVLLGTGYVDSKGNKKQLSAYQKNVLWGSIVKDMVGLGTGLTFKEWNNVMKYNEINIKNKLRKTGKGKRSKSEGLDLGLDMNMDMNMDISF